MSRVHIIGGGFSGLTCAYSLIKRGKQVDVFEKSNRLGGLLQSKQTSFGLVETAANGLLNSINVQQLFSNLNIQMAERPKSRVPRYIFRDRPREWPLRATESVRFLTGLAKLAWSKKFEVLPDEKLEEWTKRKLGPAGFDYLLAPAVQGIYGTSDLDAELIHRAVSSRKKRPSRIDRGTVAPVGGMGELIDSLRQYILRNGGEIHLNENGDLRRSHPTVIATSAPAAALILLPEVPSAAALLAQIEYLPLISVTCFFNKQAERLRGFGCLFPKKQNFSALGVLFNNSIFPGRAHEHSETWIFSQDGISEAMLMDQLREDRRRLFKTEDMILAREIHFWPHAIPWYNKGLREKLSQLELPPQVYLSGNYLGGIGLSSVLDFNKVLADKIDSEVI